MGKDSCYGFGLRLLKQCMTAMGTKFFTSGSKILQLGFDLYLSPKVDL